jgi:hypothetical protein
MTTKTLAEQIRHYREQILQLSQMHFAALTGMGVASINRLEKGADITPAHQLLLEGIQEPNNLLRALEGKEDSLGQQNIERLKSIASQMLIQQSLNDVINYQNLHYSKETSGNKTFDVKKLTEMIKFFSLEGEYKTKLNKLLFYADFYNFKESGKSISGTRYAIGEFGPIPDKQEPLFASLIQSKIIKPREMYNSQGAPYEKLYTVGDVDRKAFTKKEFSILELIKQLFSKMTAKQIADYSHEEEFYIQGTLGEPVLYEKAFTLKKFQTFPCQISEEDESVNLSIADLAKKFSSQASDESWEKVPIDGASNIDTYLYGADKKSE